MALTALLLLAASGAFAGESAMDQLQGIRQLYSILPVEEAVSTGTLRISKTDEGRAILSAEDVLYGCVLAPVGEQGEFVQFSIDCVEWDARAPLDLSGFGEGLTIAVPSKKKGP